MDTSDLAYYIWDFSRRHDGERSSDECWYLAESIGQGNRPAWLFDQEDFRPFDTGPTIVVDEVDYDKGMV